MISRTLVSRIVAGATLTAGLFAPAAHAAAPCPLPNDPVVLLNALWPIVDTNGDGNLSLREGQAIYPDLDATIFGYADLDRNGKVSRAEVMTLLPLLPVDILEYVDPNGDGVIVYSEVDEYVTQSEFNGLDRDQNGRIDCMDLEGAPGEGEPEGETDPNEGELEGEFDPGDLDLDEVCSYLPLVESMFPSVDTNHSGGVSRSELLPVAQSLGLLDSDVELAFQLLDKDLSGEVTLAEVQNLAAVYCPQGGEGEPEGEAEGEPTGLETLCSYAPMAISLFPTVDVNNDGAITLLELETVAAQLGAVLPDLAPLFTLADTDQSGGITLAELKTFLAACNGTGEGEGEGELDLAAVCQYLPLVDDVFAGADADGSGGLSLEELVSAIAFFVDPGINFAALFPLLDADGSGEATLLEIKALGAALCGTVGEGEGEGEGQIDLGEYCAYLPMVISQFPALDRNSSGGISRSELSPLLVMIVDPLPEADLLFAVLDADQNGEITVAELQAAGEQFCGAPGEGEGEGDIAFDLSEICQYLPLVDSVFPSFDTDDSGGLSLPELQTALQIVLEPGVSIEGIFPFVDADQSGEVTLPEILALGAQICGSEGEGEGNVEGELEGEPELSELCSYLPLARSLFGAVDTDSSGGISVLELEAIASNVGLELGALLFYFDAIDASGDGAITMAEINAKAEALCGVVITEPDATLVTLLRTAGGSNTYVPGETLRVSVTLRKSGPGVVTALGLSETLPAGWSLAAVVEDGGAEAAPAAGATGLLEFAWLAIPSFPVTVVYDVAVPGNATGVASIAGMAMYRLGDEDVEHGSGAVTTTLHDGDNAGYIHSADRNGDWRIALSEVLRVIQIYNLAGYHCDVTGEDGYAPGLGAVSCAPHTSDYAPQNWVISLSELLRMIQLYNAHAGAYYSAGDTEDGFAPGTYGGK